MIEPGTATSALETLGIIAVSALFGAMVFFPSVVAPTVFRALEPDDAGRFLRRLFPSYYAFMIIMSLVAAATLYARPLLAGGLALVAATTLFVRQFLVPKINAWRDAELAGDASAGKKFATGHRASVMVNVAQLVFVGVAIFLLWR